MAISYAYNSGGTISTTETSILSGAAYDTGTNSAVDGVYMIFLDLNDMTTGDELQVRVYEKVRAADTQRIVYQANLFGLQSPPIYVIPSLILMHAWDVTLDAIAGTIDVVWSVVKVA